MLPAMASGLVLAGMLLMPGWALLTIGDAWVKWAPLQRWCLAVGLSIAVYPVLFYAARALGPTSILGPYKLTFLLVGSGLFTLWRLRRHWREQVDFDGWEWAALGLVGLTLATRFWIIRDQLYPAWSDSLHHVLLTDLTAVQGRLPSSLEPYFPVPLGEYHLGLYALSGSLEMLARLPAYTALLWTAQALNGLCGLGVYLVLDRKVGRLAAVIGVAVVGLVSRQPAWYVNWGRFTQIASQAILPIAWLLTWEALSSWRTAWPRRRAMVIWETAGAALLTGAVFLLHFRVAAFYFPLLGLVVVWELVRASRERRLSWVLLGASVCGLISLIFVWPALLDALRVYVAQARAYSTLPAAAIARRVQIYYEVPASALPILVGQGWLMVLAVAAALIGIWRRSKFVWLMVLWTVLLLGLGNAYLLHIPLLNVTNLGAVLIMLYLPIGMTIGAAVQVIRPLVFGLRPSLLTGAAASLTLTVVLLLSPARATEIEPMRYFVTPADLPAMDWIKANTAPDARFAINTYFWTPNTPQGTDAGYWIPYFTHRQTTAGDMLSSLGSPEYLAQVVAMSRAVEHLETDAAALVDLRRLGLDYIYIGARGSFSGPGLDVSQLRQLPGITVVYQRDGVSILRIEPAAK